MKGIRAKKSGKMKKIHGEFSVAEEEINSLTLRSESASDKDTQVYYYILQFALYQIAVLVLRLRQLECYKE